MNSGSLAVKKDAVENDVPMAREGLYADYIHDWRLKLGTTQAQFADALGVDERSVRHWEAGTVEPEADKLEQIKQLGGHDSPAVSPKLRHHCTNMGISVTWRLAPAIQSHSPITAVGLPLRFNSR